MSSLLTGINPRLTGTKTWVSNAIRANLFLVFAMVREATKIFSGRNTKRGGGVKAGPLRKLFRSSEKKSEKRDYH